MHVSMGWGMCVWYMYIGEWECGCVDMQAVEFLVCTCMCIQQLYVVSCPDVHAHRRRTSGGLSYISCHRGVSSVQ